MKDEGWVISARKPHGCGMPPITYRLSFIALLLQCGCSYLPTSGGDFQQSNYFSYEHAFTEAGTAGARKSAETQCSHRKQAAVRTSGTCSLARCTSHYQCMDAADAAKYQPGDGKK